MAQEHMGASASEPGAVPVVQSTGPREHRVVTIAMVTAAACLALLVVVGGAFGTGVVVGASHHYQTHQHVVDMGQMAARHGFKGAGSVGAGAGERAPSGGVVVPNQSGRGAQPQSPSAADAPAN